MSTTPDIAYADDDEVFALTCAEPPRRRRPPVDAESRRYNEALWRITRGKPDIGGICHELSVITGLSPETVRARADSIEYQPEPLAAGIGLTSADYKYLGKRCKNSRDPEVREFFQRISGGQRKDPDHENPRVTRQRIGNKLISIAKDLPKN